MALDVGNVTNLPKLINNDNNLFYTLGVVNSYSAEQNLIIPIENVNFMKIEATQLVRLQIRGFSTSNYIYDAAQQKCVKSDLYYPDFSNNIFYLLSHNAKISYVNIKVYDTSELLNPSSSVSVCLRFFKDVSVLNG